MGIHGRCRHPRIAFRHSHKQKELVMAKYAILQARVGTPPRTEVNGGWGGPLLSFRTLSTPSLDEAYAICYPGGKKGISLQWLEKVSPTGLAWWFMDDGSVGGNYVGCRIATDSFPRYEQEILVGWLRDAYGVHADIHHTRRDLFHLSMNKEAGNRFSQIIAPHILPSMQYKLYKAESRNCPFCGESFLPNDGSSRQWYCRKTKCQIAGRKQKGKQYYLDNKAHILSRVASYQSARKAKRKSTI